MIETAHAAYVRCTENAYAQFKRDGDRDKFDSAVLLAWSGYEPTLTGSYEIPKAVAEALARRRTRGTPMTIKACECGEACGEVDFGGLMYVAIKGGDPLLAQLGVNDVVAPPVWLLVLLTRDGNDYVMHALPRAAAATQVGLAAIVAKFPRRMNVYVQREVGGHTFPLVWD